jgi:hypothetical protein
MKSAIRRDGDWSVAASHELLEMLADPYINLAAAAHLPDLARLLKLGPGDSLATEGELLYAYEACDPCASVKHSYRINGVRVSNFVFPEWFQPIKPTRQRGAALKFDVRGYIRQPFEILPGGYSLVFGHQGWRLRVRPRDGLEFSSRAEVGSRRERRMTPRQQWRLSRC